MTSEPTYSPLERITEAAMRNTLGDEAAVCVLLEGDDDAAMIATLFGLLLNQIAAVAHYQRIPFDQAVRNLAMQVHLDEITREAPRDAEARARRHHPGCGRVDDI